WLAAETAESFMASLQHIAEQLQLPEQQVAEQARIVRAIQRWLEEHSGWLLIGDNVEDVDVVQTVLPHVQQGTLLLTTRHQTLGPLAEPLPLQPMSSEESRTLVLRRARLLNGPALATASLERTLPETPFTPATIELVNLLEGLPLALDQAG